MEKQGRSGILFRCFKEHTKIGLDICAGTCYNIVRKCGHRTSASISAFQAEEVGSIPIARSMQKKSSEFSGTRGFFAGQNRSASLCTAVPLTGEPGGVRLSFCRACQERRQPAGMTERFQTESLFTLPVYFEAIL